MRICHEVYAYDFLMLKIEQMLVLKIEQLFANLTIIDCLGSPYAGFMLKSCPCAGILTQHNVKLAADKGKDDALRQQMKEANEGSKLRQRTKISRKSGRKRIKGRK